MRGHCVAERVGIAHGPPTRACLDSTSVGVRQGRPASADQEQSMTAIAQTRTAPTSWPGLSDGAVADELPAPRCTPKRGLVMETGMMFLDCPTYMDKHGAIRCGLPAEMERPFTVQSTDGPLESAKIRCRRGHW